MCIRDRASPLLLASAKFRTCPTKELWVPSFYMIWHRLIYQLIHWLWKPIQLSTIKKIPNEEFKSTGIFFPLFSPLAFYLIFTVSIQFLKSKWWITIFTHSLVYVLLKMIISYSQQGGHTWCASARCILGARSKNRSPFFSHPSASSNSFPSKRERRRWCMGGFDVAWWWG